MRPFPHRHDLNTGVAGRIEALMRAIMRNRSARITNKNAGAVPAPEKYNSHYKGSAIEIASQYHAPDKWSVSFEIPATLFRSLIPVGRMMKDGFVTRDDALAWARKEIDGFVKSSFDVRS